MDVTVSRRKNITKKGNKENAQPAHERKPHIKGDKTTIAPFQLKNGQNQQILPKSQPLKAKAKQADSRSVCEAQKPVPAAVLSSRNALGLYKGKIVQSKIGSIWKASTNVGADPNPSAPKMENQRAGNVARRRSKSVAEMPKCGIQKPAPVRSKSVSDRRPQMSRPAASSRPAGFSSARPPTRIVPATLTIASSRNTTVAPTKASGTQNPKPKISETDKKVSKPPASNAISQYRFTMESAEERRAKLAEWLASKGKALKRPAMTTAKSSKTKVSSKPDVKPQSQPGAWHIPESRLEGHEADPAVGTVPCGETQGAEPTASSQTPVIMNTTLDLLENCDGDLSAEERVDDIILNLCDALEAMATPTSYSDGETEEYNNVEMEGSKPVSECKEEGLKNDMPEDGGKEVKDEAEESDQNEETDVESDDGVIETTPQMENGSMIKYSVKTTPYLQSVKKTIEEVSASTSKRKSNIKDIKLLTPVRRSCRIQQKSTQLPKMLFDHDPCVSSLAELVKLDDAANAYIYRKNTALTADLPDESTL
ncbi:cytoskeleton-associated protein 2 [Archocentrus centrarchus]|uniref:cytoskeleton-associated protein 2 n=1 Tax=Archocentrus centrarchus TaxID=63155 RepID=UPI0011E9DE52|nr:cytoskeleton-associated protein 2-like [Archocentrus centrarchus]